MRKRALVLSGGGTKGVYQCGVVSALKKLGKDNWDIITGTSVGALNAAMLVQGDFDAMEAMYENLEAEQIVNGYVPRDLSLQGLLRDHRNVLPALGDYLKN
jgi:NTE family protein